MWPMKEKQIISSVPSRYLVERPLGSGGQGSVYRVLDSIRRANLALKIVGSEEREWLRREFDVLRRIRHENLVQVFDWGTLESGDAYYTMELVDGGDWSKKMGVPQPVHEVRAMLAGILRGLAHLHCHGEIHGDLKPGNVLVGPQGLVKIADVGMGTENGGSRSGTPGYTAPEVWEGKPADERSDIYSLGVLAYEALSARHPFSGLTVREVVTEQLRGAVTSPSSIVSDLPRDLDRAITKAMERDPRLRQASADEFIESIGATDRVGEILDGQFADRVTEVRRLEELIRRESPGPTLALITGAPGVGKTYLISEIADRAARDGSLVIDLSTHSTSIEDICEAVNKHTRRDWHAKGEGARTSSLAESLWRIGLESGVLCLVDTQGSDSRDHMDVVFPVARYLWALSQERGRHANVFFLFTAEGNEHDLEFGESFNLQPFGEVEVWEQVTGLLGRVGENKSVRTQLHKLTGGNPGLIRSAIAELVSEGALARLDGAWSFREGVRLESLDLGSTSGALRNAWTRLTDELRSALLQCAVAADGISLAEGDTKSSSATLGELLTVLQSKDWAHFRERRWHMASELARTVALSLAEPASVREAAKERLARLGGEATADQVAELAFHAGATKETLPTAIESAAGAIAKGANRVAASRLSRLIKDAQKINEVELLEKMSFMLAEALHSQGNDTEAVAALRLVMPPIGPASARRDLLLGLALRRLGDLDEARASFERALESLGNGDRGTFLRAHAALAELDWELGGIHERAGAITRIREVLDATEQDGSLREERAALFYGLGAALIRAGDRQEAKAVLTRGMNECESDYWKMRLSNALGSAALYLGEFNDAISWANKALDFADRAGVDAFRPRILTNRGAVLYVFGRFRESAKEDQEAAIWAERLGNEFESAAGRAGAAVNLVLLAKYEESLHEAALALHASERAGDKRMIGKAREIGALAYFHIGDMASAEAEARQGLVALDKREYVDVLPRIDWLIARIMLRNGQELEAIDLLRSAEDGLIKTNDLEDLWGVRIDLNRALAMRGDDVASRAEAIMKIFNDANSKGIVVVEVMAAVALSEIRLNTERHDPRLFDRALARAEECGMLEASWRLSFHLGRIAAGIEDMHTATTRYMHATRVLREIAGGLTPTHRDIYLAQPDVTAALDSMRRRN